MLSCYVSVCCNHVQNVQAHSKILGENNGLWKSFPYVLPFAALTENKGAGKKIFPSCCL